VARYALGRPLGTSKNTHSGEHSFREGECELCSPIKIGFVDTTFVKINFDACFDGTFQAWRGYACVAYSAASAWRLLSQGTLKWRPVRRRSADTNRRSLARPWSFPVSSNGVRLHGPQAAYAGMLRFARRSLRLRRGRMLRIWRSGAGYLLAACFVLDFQELMHQRAASVSLTAVGIFCWFALRGFLIWRIWRGGSLAWTVLMAWNGCILAITVFGSSWPQSPSTLALIIITIIQIATLFSPAIRKQIRQHPDSTRNTA
jgi:hypothetical protein